MLQNENTQVLLAGRSDLWLPIIHDRHADERASRISFLENQVKVLLTTFQNSAVDTAQLEPLRATVKRLEPLEAQLNTLRGSHTTLLEEHTKRGSTLETVQQENERLRSELEAMRKLRDDAWSASSKAETAKSSSERAQKDAEGERKQRVMASCATHLGHC